MPNRRPVRGARALWLLATATIVTASVVYVTGLQGGGSAADARLIQSTIQKGLQAVGDACLTDGPGALEHHAQQLARYWSDVAPTGDVLAARNALVPAELPIRQPWVSTEIASDTMTSVSTGELDAEEATPWPTSTPHWFPEDSVLTDRLADAKACEAGGYPSLTAPATAWELIAARGPESAGAPGQAHSPDGVLFSLDPVTLTDLQVDGDHARVEAEVVQTIAMSGRRETSRHVEHFKLRRTDGTWRIVWNQSARAMSDLSFADHAPLRERASVFLTLFKWRIGGRGGPMVCEHPAYANLSKGMTMTAVRDKLGDPHRISAVYDGPSDPAHETWRYGFEGWGGDIRIRFDGRSRVELLECGWA